MASIFWNDKKASKEEAKKSLMQHIADNWSGAFTVAFHSDDGGEHIMAVVEVEDTNVMMEQSFRNKFPAKWMGWRLMVLKVPIGHVKVFFNKK
jgi:hypothetical protein